MMHDSKLYMSQNRAKDSAGDWPQGGQRGIASSPASDVTHQGCVQENRLKSAYLSEEVYGEAALSCLYTLRVVSLYRQTRQSRSWSGAAGRAGFAWSSATVIMMMMMIMMMLMMLMLFSPALNGS